MLFPFLNEDLIAPCEDREEMLEYLQDFSEEEYTIVNTADARFYVKEEKKLEEDANVLHFLERYIKEGTTVVDFGAQNGARAFFFSRFVGLQGNVLAFESNAELFRELFWNAMLNNVQNMKLFYKVQSLDSLELTDVSVMYIDGSGREDIFLNNAKKTIQACKPALILNMIGGVPMERHDRYIKEVYDNRIERFRDLGYTIQRIDKDHYLALPTGKKSPGA